MKRNRAKNRRTDRFFTYGEDLLLLPMNYPPTGFDLRQTRGGSIIKSCFILIFSLWILSCQEQKDLKQTAKSNVAAVSAPMRVMEYPVYPLGSDILFGKPVSRYSPDWEAAYVYSLKTLDEEESRRFGSLGMDALGAWNLSVSLHSEGVSETLFRGVYKDKRDGFSHNFLMVIRGAETAESSVVMLHKFPDEDPRFDPFFVYPDGSVFWDENGPRNFKYTLAKTESGYEVRQAKVTVEFQDEFEWP